MPLLIDDGTPDSALAPPNGYHLALDLTERPAGYGYAGLAKPFPANMIVPRSEWEARAKERSKLGGVIKRLKRWKNYRPLNQGRTNHCWAYGPVNNLLMRRMLANMPFEELCPTSVACRINGFRNQGGWGRSAIEGIANFGVYLTSDWPANAINRKYQTAAGDKRAMNYRTTNYCEAQPSNLDELVSAVFWDMCPAVGYDWWGHEIIIPDLEWDANELVLVGLNSWYDTIEENIVRIAGRRRAAQDVVAAFDITD